MADITVSVTGNLVSDVAFQVTSRGDAVARFRVASTAKRLDRRQWPLGRRGHDVLERDRLAAGRRERSRQSLAKGHPVVVHGAAAAAHGRSAGGRGAGVAVPVTYTDIEAYSFGLDLNRCRARFVRAPIGPQTSELSSAAGGVGDRPGDRAGDRAGEPGCGARRWWRARGRLTRAGRGGLAGRRAGASGGGAAVRGGRGTSLMPLPLVNG